MHELFWHADGSVPTLRRLVMLMSRSFRPASRFPEARLSRQTGPPARHPPPEEAAAAVVARRAPPLGQPAEKRGPQIPQAQSRVTAIDLKTANGKTQFNMPRRCILAQCHTHLAR